MWLDVPLVELERRVTARAGDASDAGVEVLRAAARNGRPPADWVRVDAGGADLAREEVQRRLGML